MPVIHLGSAAGRNLDAALRSRGIDVIHRQVTDPISLKAELDDVARPQRDSSLLDLLEHLDRTTGAVVRPLCLVA